jgi:hypothetical protein
MYGPLLVGQSDSEGILQNDQFWCRFYQVRPPAFPYENCKIGHKSAVVAGELITNTVRGYRSGRVT